MATRVVVVALGAGVTISGPLIMETGDLTYPSSLQVPRVGLDITCEVLRAASIAFEVWSDARCTVRSWGCSAYTRKRSDTNELNFASN
jgi:hypothetical protein